MGNKKTVRKRSRKLVGVQLTKKREAKHDKSSTDKATVFGTYQNTHDVDICTNHDSDTFDIVTNNSIIDNTNNLAVIECSDESTHELNKINKINDNEKNNKQYTSDNSVTHINANEKLLETNINNEISNLKNNLTLIECTDILHEINKIGERDCNKKNYENNDDIQRNYCTIQKLHNCERDILLHHTDILEKTVDEEVINLRKGLNNLDCNIEFENIPGNLLKPLLIKGRRIVDIPFFLQQFIDVNKKHSNEWCDNPNLQARRYFDEGLGTNILFQCDNCYFEEWISSEKKYNRELKVNKMAVLATIIAGSGYEGLRKLFAGIDVPFMSHTTYVKHRRNIIPILEAVSKDEMIKAGKKEKEIAIKKGHVIQGIPWIEVEGDGGYGKRSYKSGRHDSFTCVGAIIGIETGKLLHIEVRNKCCLICFKAAKKKVKAKRHDCYKNWSINSSSSSMETDCIVEGFKKSIETHGLIYKTYIGDGDSSTYKALLDRNVYKQFNITVGRYYCSNHLFRNMCNKIVEAGRGKLNHGAIRGNVLGFREFIKKSAYRIRKTITHHIDERKNQNTDERTKNLDLQRDILNTVDHIFGQHKSCKNRGLKCIVSKKDKNWIPILKSSGVYEAIQISVKKLSCFTKSLLRQVTTNASENFNSIVAVNNDGKRINFAFRDSFYLRCLGASIQYNTGSAFSTISEYIDEDFSVAKDMESKRKDKVAYTRKYRELKGRKRNFIYKDSEKDYGNNCQQPDVSEEVYNQLVSDHFTMLNENRDNRVIIERETVKQSDCELWHEKRKFLLTASTFGDICKMRKNTSCASNVKKILYPPTLDLPALTFGLENEKKAIQLLEQQIKKKVDCCGLFIDKDHPFLGATPDGLIEEDGIVEVKSTFKGRDLTPLQAIKQLDNVRKFYSTTDLNKMNRNHKYYFQIMGQLHITQRRYCLFVLATDKGIRYIREEYDARFWNEMQSKLIQFYMHCILPEIVDPRLSRNMQLREPEYILRAQEDSLKKKLLKRKNNEKLTNSKLKDFKRRKENDFSFPNDDDSFYVNVDADKFEATSHLQTRKVNNHCNIKVKNTSTKSTTSYTEFRDVIAQLNANIKIENILKNVVRLDYQLVDDDIEQFMKIVRQYLPNFEIHPVQYFHYLHLLENPEKEKHIQIIGGGESEHWICVYFDGQKLFIYDSLNRGDSNEQEREYVIYRYENLQPHIYMPLVTQQPDSTTCGIYAAAFVTEIAFSKDPSTVNFSRSAIRMRNHFCQIIRYGKLMPFPRA